MKKFLFIAIAACAITTINLKVLAQTKIHQLQNPFTDRLELKSSIRTDFHPEKEFLVEVTIENNMEKGNMVKFKASGPVTKVVVSAFDKMTDSVALGTTNYNAGTTTGIFYLDAPAFNLPTRHKFYILTFYAQGLPDQIWSTMVERKKSAAIQKIPRKIPN